MKINSHQRFSIKILFLKFAIFTGKHLCEIIKNNYFEEHLCKAASELTLWSDSLFGTLFLDHIQNHLYSVILQKYQFLSNKRFKQNLVHMLFIYLTPMLSCKPRFCMFIINSYYTKYKCLQSLDSLLEDVTIYIVCHLTRQEIL